MKTNLISKIIWGAALSASLVCWRAGAAINSNDALELVRSIYKTDRQAVVAEALQLTETESAAFWPLYKTYRAEMEAIGDSLVKLVLEYTDEYPNLTDKRAEAMLKEYSTLEQKLTAQRAYSMKRVAKVLPATKVLRWAQLENRMDLALRLQLASTIPLAPTGKAKD